ncbi:hypothetical protein DFQ30_004818 [Apophysomyces sp. BC1015]|nr:hypothetical protein DFQ30_004818 [Apophysomyces sp. BC1015]KAG0175859.1 hypothetical protein DFQ29_006863 [Apophysomyces sp. BC1021]
MAPGALNSGDTVVSQDDGMKDLQIWLREADDAESLMTTVEAQTGSLQAKIESLLADSERNLVDIRSKKITETETTN